MKNVGLPRLVEDTTHVVLPCWRPVFPTCCENTSRLLDAIMLVMIIIDVIS